MIPSMIQWIMSHFRKSRYDDPYETEPFKLAIVPLYLDEEGVDILAHTAYEGNLISKTNAVSSKSQRKLDLGPKGLKGSFGKDAEEKTLLQSEFRSSSMLAETMLTLIEQDALRKNPKFAEIEVKDLIKISGCIESADILTKTDDLMSGVELASNLLDTGRVKRGGRQRVRLPKRQFEGLKKTIHALKEARQKNTDRYWVVSTEMDYSAVIAINTEFILRSIGEGYTISVVGIVQRIVSETQPPISLLSSNVTLIKPMIEQLDELWGQAYEDDPPAKDLPGPCLVITPIFIY